MLAESDLEPLVLADGTRINPTTGKAIKETAAKPKFLEIPNASAAQELVVKARRSVADLPAAPAQLTGVALVAFYTLFGLPDMEIAIACDNKVTIEQIKAIRKLDAYKEFMQTAKTNIVETEVATVRDVFQQHAGNAAMKIVELAQSDSDVLAFKASQDILDRAGHRPADIVEHKHSMDGELRIVVVKKDMTQEMPTIDADFSMKE